MSWAYQQREKKGGGGRTFEIGLFFALSLLSTECGHYHVSRVRAPRSIKPLFRRRKNPSHPPSHVKKSRRSSSSSSFGRADVVVVSDFVLRSLFEEEEDGNFTRRPPSRRRRRRRKSFAKPLRVCCMCRSWECACVCDCRKEAFNVYTFLMAFLP